MPPLMPYEEDVDLPSAARLPAPKVTYPQRMTAETKEPANERTTVAGDLQNGLGSGQRLAVGLGRPHSGRLSSADGGSPATPEPAQVYYALCAASAAIV